MNFVYANENHSTIINEKNGVVFITFPKLVKAGRTSFLYEFIFYSR